MNTVRNERGGVLVFATLIIVLLLIMVGMGLDTGHLAYIRSQGQPAVDAAALAAAAALPTGNPDTVKNQAAALNSKNNYLDSPNNAITNSNVTLVNYDPATGTIKAATGVVSPTSVGDANAVRVALEGTNPYGGTVGAAMKSPLFLTPLLNLFGQSTSGTTNVSVSAVAVIRGVPDLPVAVEQARCGNTNPQKLLQSDSKNDNSGYTTYYINNASATEIKGLINNHNTCNGIPPIGIGFCTELNNGQVASVYDNFESLFKANPGKCYLIPVVGNNQSWNQCSNIVDFAQFCPDATDPVQKQGNPKYINGVVTCGQNTYNTKATGCYVPTLVRDTKSGM
jgi:Flp pilus assembly protein TadG